MTRLVRVSDSTYQKLTKNAKWSESLDSIIRGLLELKENKNCSGQHNGTTNQNQQDMAGQNNVDVLIIEH